MQKRENTINVKTKNFLNNTDYILFYSKSKNYKFNIQKIPISNETIKRYNKIDKKGNRYKLENLKHSIGKFQTLNFNNKKYKGHYIWTQKTLDKRIKNGYIIELNNIGELAYRLYLKDNKGKQLSNIWTDLTEGGGLQKDYSTQKPLALMNRIILASSYEYDNILDAFCGSGSLLVQGKILNRNVYGIDINPKAIRITKNRLQDETNLFNS